MRQSFRQKTSKPSTLIRRVGWLRRLARVTVVVWFVSGLVPLTLVADEFSILQNSSVIGRNFGLPYTMAIAPERNAGELSLITEGIFFAKNLELTGSPNIDGETFIGMLVPARLAYLAADNVQIEAGAYLGRNYGDDDSLDIQEPILRVVWEPAPQQFVIAGTLVQSHWIHDALRDDVFLYRNGSETGLQYRADTPWMKADYWMDWRVRETSTRSEQFDGAGANQLRLGRLWLDGQFFWSHTGGQKNSMSMVSNSSSGMLGASLGLGPEAWPDYPVRLGASFLASQFEARGSPTTSGNGVEVWLGVYLPVPENQIVQLFAKHFEGDQFFAVQGDPLYAFDRYSQAGIDWVIFASPNLDVETGFVGQYADDTFMNTFRINLLWHNRYVLTNTRCSDPMMVYNSEDYVGEE